MVEPESPRSSQVVFLLDCMRVPKYTIDRLFLGTTRWQDETASRPFEFRYPLIRPPIKCYNKWSLLACMEGTSQRSRPGFFGSGFGPTKRIWPEWGCTSARYQALQRPSGANGNRHDQSLEPGGGHKDLLRKDTDPSGRRLAHAQPVEWKQSS